MQAEDGTFVDPTEASEPLGEKGGEEPRQDRAEEADACDHVFRVHDVAEDAHPFALGLGEEPVREWQSNMRE